MKIKYNGSNIDVMTFNKNPFCIMDLRETALSSAKTRELTGVAIGLMKAQVEDSATTNIRINGE